jgi:hypothetical protein
VTWLSVKSSMHLGMRYAEYSSLKSINVFILSPNEFSHLLSGPDITFYFDQIYSHHSPPCSSAFQASRASCPLCSPSFCERLCSRMSVWIGFIVILCTSFGITFYLCFVAIDLILIFQTHFCAGTNYPYIKLR